jgi:hypothetical protein
MHLDQTGNNVVIIATFHAAHARGCLRAVSVVLLATVFTASNSTHRNHEQAPDQSFIPVPAAPVMLDLEEKTTDLGQGKSNDLAALPPGEATSSVSPDIGAKPAAPEVIGPPATPEAAPPVATEARAADEISQYLWSVYQRTSTKLDSRGDFSWKDAVAAARLGLSIEGYVIGGMDADFRELLFRLGQAMDAAGVDWTILSAFRDDYRQSLAVGLKAHDNNSFHGGSAATGGYGHGCAVDLGGTTGGPSNYVVWNWLDQHLEQFGLFRPLRQIDPAHVLPRGGWHDLAATLRKARMEPRPEYASSDLARADLGEGPASASVEHPSSATGLSDEQFNCVRPRPPNEFNQAGAVVSQLDRYSLKHRWKTAGGASHASLQHSPAKDFDRHARWKGKAADHHDASRNKPGSVAEHAGAKSGPHANHEARAHAEAKHLPTKQEQKKPQASHAEAKRPPVRQEQKRPPTKHV